MEIEEFILLIERIRKYYSDELSINVSNTELEEALYVLLSDKEKYEWKGDLWDTKITFEEAKDVLSNFQFSILRQNIETAEDIVPDSLLFKRKVKIKSKGLLWIIHRYDLDPFPSNPHAHQLENNLKLDLATGKCYKIREYVHTISKKNLLDIRTKALKVYKGELPPLSM